MKIKQHLTITNPLEFMQGDYSTCFNLFDTPTVAGDSTGWIGCGEIELDINVDADDIRKTCLAKLDEEEVNANAEYTAKMTMLERARNELLCLTHDGRTADD